MDAPADSQFRMLWYGMQAKQLNDRETELLHIRGVVDRDRKYS